MLEQNELPNKAYYVQPMYKDVLDMGYKVPVVIVKKGVEGYFKTDYEVSSWTELNGLNDSIGFQKGIYQLGLKVIKRN